MPIRKRGTRNGFLFVSLIQYVLTCKLNQCFLFSANQAVTATAAHAAIMPPRIPLLNASPVFTPVEGFCSGLASGFSSAALKEDSSDMKQKTAIYMISRISFSICSSMISSVLTGQLSSFRARGSSVQPRMTASMPSRSTNP